MKNGTRTLELCNPHAYAEYIAMLRSEGKLFAPDGSINEIAFEFNVVFSGKMDEWEGNQNDAECLAREIMLQVITGEFQFVGPDSAIKIPL